MKKRVLAISVTYTMCSALKEMDIFCNEGIKYYTFHKEGIKMRKKLGGAVRSTWVQGILISEGFKEEGGIWTKTYWWSFPQWESEVGTPARTKVWQYKRQYGPARPRILEVMKEEWWMMKPESYIEVRLWRALDGIWRDWICMCMQHSAFGGSFCV